MGLEGRKKKEEREEEITDRGNVDGYHDGNPIYSAICIIWFGTRITPDYDAFKDKGRTVVHTDNFTQHTK